MRHLASIRHGRCWPRRARRFVSPLGHSSLYFSLQLLGASPQTPPGPDLPLLFKLHDIWLVGSQENHKNCFKAKMHQIRFQLGLPHRPDGGAYSAPPDSLAGFKGPTSKGREREGGKERPSFTGRFGTWNFLSFIPSFCPK